MINFCRPLSNKIILIDEPLISPDQNTLSYFEDIKTLKINNIIIISSSLEIYNKLADKNITLNYPKGFHHDRIYNMNINNEQISNSAQNHVMNEEAMIKSILHSNNSTRYIE